VSITGLVSALLVGLAIGALGRLVVPGPKSVPIWLTVALGVSAALLGSITAGVVGLDFDRFDLLQLIVQVVFAGGTVVSVVALTERRPSDSV
jgi:uncharacterized membrane protein YeaQ/YmgE (transglycosylase-associated protein family)